MPTLRLFVALPMLAEVRARLAAQQQRLKRAFPRGLAYSPPENYHLTLRFLGEVDSERIEALTAALGVACADFNATSLALDLRCERLGCFPNLRAPRVVWAGVSASDGALEHLQSLVAKACAPFAVEPEENRFAPHITLARVRHLERDKRQSLTQHIEAGVSLSFGRWTPSEVLLMQSEIGNGPTRYSVLGRFSIGA